MKPKPMNRNPPDDESLAALKTEVTHEVTGDDSPPDDAETGSAGNGAAPFGADLTGEESPAPVYEDEYKLEGDPGDPHDIAPDKVEMGFEDPEAEDREYTARPRDDWRPITPDLLPTYDPHARRGK